MFDLYGASSRGGRIQMKQHKQGNTVCDSVFIVMLSILLWSYVTDAIKTDDCRNPHIAHHIDIIKIEYQNVGRATHN